MNIGRYRMVIAYYSFSQFYDYAAILCQTLQPELYTVSYKNGFKQYSNALSNR
jgi:hypothetical protein